MLTLENSRGLAAILIEEDLDGAHGEDLVQWAQDALEQGHHSPSLIRLAIEEPPFFTPDLRRLFHEAVQELGYEPVGFERARAFHAQAIAIELLSASASPREIAGKLSRLYPPERSSPPFAAWWQLDEAFDCDYCLQQVTVGGQTLDETVYKELEALLHFDWRSV
jgi:hypothetical protein